MKIYFTHGMNDTEFIECEDGWDIGSNHREHVKECDILIFKLNEDGVISKGILNEIQAAQEADIPIYLWENGRLTDNKDKLRRLPLKKWKRNFKNTEHPFRKEI